MILGEHHLQGEKADSFFVVASGEVIVKARDEKQNDMVEMARVKPYDTSANSDCS